MSVQTTIDLTRAEAEKMCVDVMVESLRKNFEGTVKTMTDKAIEDCIEEEFYNYNIV